MMAAEEKKRPGVRASEHIALVLLLLLGLVGAVAMLFFLLPFLFLGDIVISVAVLLLAGLLLGLLLVAALKSLRIHPQHHVAGMSLLFIISSGFSVVIIGLLQRGIPGAYNPVLLACSLSFGIIIPYLLERRLHGTA